MKKLRGALRSKTMWFSGILTLLGAISDNSSYLQGLVSPENFNKIMMGVGIMIAILRYQTNKSLEQK